MEVFYQLEPCAELNITIRGWELSARCFPRINASFIFIILISFLITILFLKGPLYSNYLHKL